MVDRCHNQPEARRSSHQFHFLVHEECSTEPSGLVDTDEGAAEYGKGQMDVGPALVAGGQAPEPPQLGHGVFHQPTVPSWGSVSV